MILLELRTTDDQVVLVNPERVNFVRELEDGLIRLIFEKDHFITVQGTAEGYFEMVRARQAS